MTDPTVPPRPNVFTPTASGAAAAPGTPTAEVIVSAPKKTVTKSDALNRMLTVRWLAPLDRMRLAKIVGKDGAVNEVYLGYAALAYAVTQIDDDPVVATTAREIEVLVERLGEEGLECVGSVFQNEFKSFMKGPAVDDAKN